MSMARRSYKYSHFSVKEFSMPSHLASAGEHLSCYHMLPHSAHTVLVRASLRVLLNLDNKWIEAQHIICPTSPVIRDNFGDED